MTASELLLALSAKKKGSWHQFKEAVDMLTRQALSSEDEPEEDILEQGSFPIHQEVRFNLLRLSHVEFFGSGCEHGWRVAPPLMAINKHAKGHKAVLTGARSENQIYNLLSSSIGNFVELKEMPLCPDRISIHNVEIETLEQTGAQLGIRVQREASETILQYLQTIPAIPRPNDIQVPPFGNEWKIEYLNVESNLWNRVESLADIPDTVAMIRFTGPPFEKLFFFRQEGNFISVSDQSVGKFQLLSSLKCNVLSYDPEQLILSVPRVFRPPLLIERALILYSGELPQFNEQEKKLEYSKIPIRAAKIVCSLLKQELLRK